MLTGRVFITGGAGFIGRALLERARREAWPARFTVFSRDDHKHAAMRRDYPEAAVIRGDVAGPLEHLAAAMAGHDTVIHAAANKHVDLSELNVAETIRNNVNGSLQVMQAAFQAGVGRLVGISTDKAAGPVNVYGATKFMMERAFIEGNRYGGPLVTCTRYGNVIGSSGSVLTVWRRQLAEGRPVTVTDPDMTRFWLTADQATSLILRALQADPGVVVVPLLPALRMGDLLAWVAPGAEVKVIGLRPGERQHETLLTDEEGRRAELRGDDTVWLRAAADQVGPRGSFGQAYRSDSPLRFLSRAEALEMAA